MSPAECDTRCVVENSGMNYNRSFGTLARSGSRHPPAQASRFRASRRLAPRKILACMVGGTGQPRCRYHQKTLGIRHGLVSLEFVRRNEANHRMMPARGLQVLANGEEIDT